MILGRLSLMMFLQFFIWGAWYTTIAVYMSNQNLGDLTHWPYTVNPIAAILSPFLIGLIADRYFSTEKVLAFLHLAGGVVLFMAPQFIGNPTTFIMMLLLYNLCYMPTLGLSNSLAFHHIEDQEKQFPMIRVFGTLGWIVAGLVISFVLGGLVGVLPESALPIGVDFADVQPEQTALPIYASAFASILLGFYSFTLPHTPPSGKGKKVSFRTIAGLDAFEQLGSRSFYIFIISSLLICIPLAAYYNFTQTFLAVSGIERIAATQTLGQASEVIFMLLMPLFFVRLGVKKMLLVGMGAWVVRYLLFAAAAPTSIFWMIAIGILLHGICYDFFFVTGQIYVDKKSTPAIRGQAQGFLVLVTYGVGMLIGAQIAGNVYNSFLDEGASGLTKEQFQEFWFIPAGFALLVLIFFGLAFKEDKSGEDSQPSSAETESKQAA